MDLDTAVLVDEDGRTAAVARGGGGHRRDRRRGRGRVPGHRRWSGDPGRAVRRHRRAGGGAGHGRGRRPSATTPWPSCRTVPRRGHHRARTVRGGVNQIAPARQLAGLPDPHRRLRPRLPWSLPVLPRLDRPRLGPGRYPPACSDRSRPRPRPPGRGRARATVASGAAYTLGWRFRWTGPVFAVSLLAVLSCRNGWGHLFHNDNLLSLQVLVAGLAPAADAWSLAPATGSNRRRACARVPAPGWRRSSPSSPTS